MKFIEFKKWNNLYNSFQKRTHINLFFSCRNIFFKIQNLPNSNNSFSEFCRYTNLGKWVVGIRQILVGISTKFGKWVVGIRQILNFEKNFQNLKKNIMKNNYFKKLIKIDITSNHGKWVVGIRQILNFVDWQKFSKLKKILNKWKITILRS